MLGDKARRHDLGRIGSELKTDTDVVMQWRKRKSVAPRREGLPSNPKPQTKLTLGQSCGTKTSGRVGDQVREAVTRRYGVLSSNEHAANGRCTGAHPALVVQEGTVISVAPRSPEAWRWCPQTRQKPMGTRMAIAPWLAPQREQRSRRGERCTGQCVTPRTRQSSGSYKGKPARSASAKHPGHQRR